MKKTLSVFWVLTLCLFVLAGCGKSAEVKAAENAISAIGEVSTESGDLISTAEKLYAALTEEDIQKVENADTLVEARKIYNILVQAAEIEDSISAAVSNVTVNSSESIAEAAKAYNNAPVEVQEKVSNYDTLIVAQQQVSKLRVEGVEKLIDAIGNISLESNTALTEAVDAYKALSSDEKAAVANFDVLTNALEEFKSLRKEEANKLLSSMKREDDPFQGCSFYYPNTWKFYGTYWAADISCFVRPYLVLENNGDAWLRIIYNYTGDSWVFFKKVILLADGKRFEKTFNYFDIVHDNGGGDVWEYIDDFAGDSEISMLTAISNATETIVRFEGDNYSQDWIMPQKEKDGIKTALAAYTMLK